MRAGSDHVKNPLSPNRRRQRSWYEVAASWARSRIPNGPPFSSSARCPGIFSHDIDVGFGLCGNPPALPCGEDASSGIRSLRPTNRKWLSGSTSKLSILFYDRDRYPRASNGGLGIPPVFKTNCGAKPRPSFPVTRIRSSASPTPLMTVVWPSARRAFRAERSLGAVVGAYAG